MLVRILVVALTVLAAFPYAQGPAFEVATVKPNKAGGRFGIVFTPGRITATNSTLERLIHMAFVVPEFRLMDAPAWIAQLAHHRTDWMSHGMLRGRSRERTEHLE